MNYISIDEDKFDEFFNEGNYNPPLINDGVFEDQFYCLTSQIGEGLESLGFLPIDLDSDDGDFVIYDGVSSGRFIDVTFENEKCDDENVHLAIQQILNKQPTDWMVSVYFCDFHYFITQRKMYRFEL